MPRVESIDRDSGETPVKIQWMTDPKAYISLSTVGFEDECSSGAVYASMEGTVRAGV